MSWITFVIILILLLCAYGGFRRGALESLIGLIGFVLSLVFGFLFYSSLANFLNSSFHISIGIANLSSFLAIILVFQILYSVVTVVVYKKVHEAEEKRFVWNLDHKLGFIPGIISGWVFVAITMLCLITLPISPSVKNCLNKSSFAKLSSNSIKFLAPEIENIFIPAANDTELAIRNINDALLPESNSLDFTFPSTLTLKIDENQEYQMLNLVNSERKSKGLKSLKMNEKVREVARQHSLEMFKLSYFEHNSPVSGTPFDRIKSSGIVFISAGENIAYAPSVNSAHIGLMNSQKHKDNILSADFTEVGIGVVSADNWGSMYTQDFIGR